MTDPADVVTVRVTEAAQMLGISKELVYKEIRANRLPAIRRGKRLTLIPVDALHEWVTSQARYGEKV